MTVWRTALARRRDAKRTGNAPAIGLSRRLVLPRQALFVTGGEVTTLPKQMWDDALLRVSPTLAAVATLLLLFMSGFILVSEVMKRRAAKLR